MVGIVDIRRMRCAYWRPTECFGVPSYARYHTST